MSVCKVKKYMYVYGQVCYMYVLPSLAIKLHGRQNSFACTCMSMKGKFYS